METIHLQAAKLRCKLINISHNVKGDCIPVQSTHSNSAAIFCAKCQNDKISCNNRKAAYVVHNEVLLRENSEIKSLYEILAAQSTQKDALLAQVNAEFSAFRMVSANSKQMCDDKLREYQQYDLYLKAVREESDQLKLVVTKVQAGFLNIKEKYSQLSEERADVAKIVNQYAKEIEQLKAALQSNEMRVSELVSQYTEEQVQHEIVKTLHQTTILKLQEKDQRLIRMQESLAALTKQVSNEQSSNNSMQKQLVEVELRAKLALDNLQSIHALQVANKPPVPVPVPVPFPAVNHTNASVDTDTNARNESSRVESIPLDVFIPANELLNAANTSAKEPDTTLQYTSNADLSSAVHDRDASHIIEEQSDLSVISTSTCALEKVNSPKSNLSTSELREVTASTVTTESQTVDASKHTSDLSTISIRPDNTPKSTFLTNVFPTVNQNIHKMLKMLQMIDDSNDSNEVSNAVTNQATSTLCKDIPKTANTSSSEFSLNKRDDQGDGASQHSHKKAKLSRTNQCCVCNDEAYGFMLQCQKCHVLEVHNACMKLIQPNYRLGDEFTCANCK